MRIPSFRTLSALCGSAVIAVTGLAFASTARAADTPYCTASVAPVGSDAAGATHCFTTFADSISYATNGRVKLANAATSRSVSAAEIAASTATPSASAAGSVSPALSVIISIDYQDANFGGSSFVWTAGSGCGAFQAASMPSGWNDVVSSVATYNGCGVTLYQNGSYGGTHFNVGVNSSAANLGSFNDQASSEKWCTAPTC